MRVIAATAFALVAGCASSRTITRLAIHGLKATLLAVGHVHRFGVALFIFFAALSQQASAAPPALAFDVTALPSLAGAEFCIPVAINNSGTVAGTCDRTAVIWTRGQLTEIDCPRGAVACFSRAINERGQVALDVLA